jgi:hypothetical protein
MSEQRLAKHRSAFGMQAGSKTMSQPPLLTEQFSSRRLIKTNFVSKSVKRSRRLLDLSLMRLCEVAARILKIDFGRRKS